MRVLLLSIAVVLFVVWPGCVVRAVAHPLQLGVGAGLQLPQAMEQGDGKRAEPAPPANGGPAVIRPKAPAYLLLTALGVAMLFWGVYASNAGKRPFDLVGSAVAPLGVIVALLGIVLFAVPAFFTGRP